MARIVLIIGWIGAALLALAHLYVTALEGRLPWPTH